MIKHVGVVLEPDKGAFDAGATTFGCAFVDEDDPNITYFYYSGSKDTDREFGTIVDVEKGKGIVVKCGKGFLLIKKVQLEGKEKISAWQFWQGARLNTGDKFQ